VKDNKDAGGIAAIWFPRYAGEIGRAYEDSAQFRSICDDLHTCRIALIHWNSVNSDDGAARRKEYGELLESLKQEVLDWLGSHGLLRDDKGRG
jgi:hypothetical protein